MPQVDFTALPDRARAWVFAAERALTAEERAQLLETVDAFLAQWAAHGVPLVCGRDWRYDRFLLVAVDEEAAGVSGCSIDALTRQLKVMEDTLGLALLDNGPVHFRREDHAIERVSRPAFGTLVEKGDVTPEVVVFDNTVPTVGAIRAGKWETNAQRTWHGRVFFS